MDLFLSAPPTAISGPTTMLTLSGTFHLVVIYLRYCTGAFPYSFFMPRVRPITFLEAASHCESDTAIGRHNTRLTRWFP